MDKGGSQEGASPWGIKMELNAKHFPERTDYSGKDDLFLNTKDSLRIRIVRHGAPNEDILDKKVANGKKWLVGMDLKIVETDE